MPEKSVLLKYKALDGNAYYDKDKGLTISGDKL